MNTSHRRVLRRISRFVVVWMLFTTVSIANAAPEDWPRFWRERASPETSGLLDQVYWSKTKCTEIIALCERAIVELQSLLEVESATASARPNDMGRVVLGLEFLSALFNEVAMLYQDTVQYEKALPLFQRALAIREAVFGPEHPEVAVSLNNLAGLYRAAGEYDKALPLYQRSLAIYEKTSSTELPALADSLYNVSGLYREMGQYLQALPLIQRSLAIREQVFGREHVTTAAALNDLALLYESMGQYPQALSASQRSLDIDKKVLGSEHPDVATSMNNVASLYKKTGQYAQALSLYKRSLSIREKTLGSEHPDVAGSLNNVASLYQDIGQPAQALPLYQRGLAIYEKKLGPEHPSVAPCLNNIAALYWEMGQYALALPLYQRSLTILEKTLGPEHPYVAVALNNVAVLYQNTGRYAKALPLLYRAEQISVRNRAPEIAWGVQVSLQNIYAVQGQPAFASFWGKEAVNAIQGTRAGLVSLDRDQQKGFIRDKKNAYRGLIDLLIGQGRLAEAQHVLSILKEEEQLEYLQRNPDKDPRAMRVVYTKFEHAWVERYERESAALGTLGTEYRSLDGTSTHVRTPQAIQRLHIVTAAGVRAREKYETFIEELKGAFAKESKLSVEFTAEDTEQLQGLQRQLAELGHGAVAVQYLVTEKRVRILVTTSQGIVHRDSPITEKDLNASIDRYRKVLENPKLDPFVDAQNLYNYLIKPIEADLKKSDARVLMVSLDGRLRYLPIAALYDGKEWLAEKYAVAIYTPVTRSNLRAQPRAEWRVAGFGVSDGGDGAQPLTYVPVELDEIIRTSAADKNGIVGGEIYLNEKAREDVLARVIQEQLHPVIHMASHFMFTLGGTLADSYFLLGQGKRLTLEQFNTEKFSMKGVDLLVLSACQTAMEGETQDGRELEGFGNLAQAQGAQAVLATQWSVNDRSTAKLMQEFYAQREGKQLTKAEALQRAQLSLLQGHTDAVMASDTRQPAEQRGQPIRDGVLAQAEFTPSAAAPYAHPYYWAPFILMGNWL